MTEASMTLDGVRLRVGSREILRDASLSLQRGEMGLLTGPSGTGKSALLRLLLGLRPRASSMDERGRVELLGQDALRTPTRQLARRAGLLFQDAHLQLTQLDVAAELAFRPENLGLPARDVEERVERVATQCGLASLLERPVSQLSGGETKRVALAALLAAEPEVLLLDEPLGGLDAQWRSALARDLQRERGARAILCVEHRAADLRSLRPRVWTMRDARPEPASFREPIVHLPQGATKRSGPRAILVEGLVVRRGDRAVLDGLDFEAGPGITLLRGPNGSGKTTLLRALLGLEPSEGTMQVAGLDPRGEGAHPIARVAGYVPQRPEDMFFCASLREEIAAGPRNLGVQPAPGIADALGLGPLLDRHPLTLSGGEQQRLALACALAHGPRVLLLDEPTVGLDARGLASALQLVTDARRDATIVIASHDPELLRMADAVVELREGRAVRTVEVAA